MRGAQCLFRHRRLRVRAVPEITGVIDVTDHASGAHPFYEAAKK